VQDIAHMNVNPHRFSQGRYDLLERKMME